MALTIAQNIPLLSLAGNPMKVKIHTDNLYDGETRRPFYTIILNVYSQSNSLLRQLSAEPDSNGDAWFNLSEIFESLKPTLKYPMATTLPITADTNACTQFYFKLAEGYGIPYTEQAESLTSSTYYVIPGGLSDLFLRKLAYANTNFYQQLQAQNIWLTNQPANKVIFADQPEQLRFFHLNAANQTASIKVRRLSNLGVESTITIWNGTLFPYTNYSVLASPAVCALENTVSYAVYFEINGAPASNEATFIVEKAKPSNTRYAYFQNSLGGFDCVALTGKMLTEIEAATVDFLTPEIEAIRESLMPEQGRASAIKYLTGTVGWKTDSELMWLSELIHSENRKLVLDDDYCATMVLAMDRTQVGADSYAPKTFSIEAAIDVADMYYTAEREIIVPQLALLGGGNLKLTTAGNLNLIQRI